MYKSLLTLFLLTAVARGQNIDQVNTFLGVDNGGNVTPGAQVPFGFISLGPDTTASDTSGYASDGRILGFSHTHESGTGGQSKYGNFRIAPTLGSSGLGEPLTLKTKEAATPGFYSVQLLSPSHTSSAVRVELTASKMVGISRFTYPDKMAGNILVDATSHICLGGTTLQGPDGIPNQRQVTTSVTVRIVDDRHIEGSASFLGGWNPDPYTLYFFAEFNRSAKLNLWQGTGDTAKLIGGYEHTACTLKDSPQCRLGIRAHFNSRLSNQVVLKTAVSFVSIERAKAHLAEEVGAQPFDKIHVDAAAAWNRVLRLIDIEGARTDQRAIFYSLLYRVHTMPHDLSGDNRWWVSSEPHYEDFYCLWDTFRTQHPLLLLLEPDRERSLIRSLLDTYKNTGWLPDARIAGSNGLVQGGSNGDVLLADAIVKGLEGFDKDVAYEAMRKDATESSDRPLRQGRSLSNYLALGYIPLSEQRSASRTLEYAYDDYVIATVADLMGRKDDARAFLKRSADWKALWDPNLNCVHPRYGDGRWLENYRCNLDWTNQRPTSWSAPFYEGSGWQYSTYVPQDMQGLVALLGGKEKFVKWLDDFFSGGNFNPGNEPDFLAPYAYIDGGRPDKATERVRSILQADYRDSRGGLPGNDDSGAMSAWYVWSSIGIYPSAGQPWYYIVCPSFAKTVLYLEDGRTFVVKTDSPIGPHSIIQSATLNGQPLDRAWLTHREVASGGQLDIVLTDGPSSWGQTRPPTGQINDRPMQR